MWNFVLDTNDKVKKKLRLLATLENIRVAMPIFSNPDNNLNILDSYYQKLNCTLTRLHEDVNKSFPKKFILSLVLIFQHDNRVHKKRQR